LRSSRINQMKAEMRMLLNQILKEINMKNDTIIATENVPDKTGMKARTNVKTSAKAICSLLTIVFTLALAIPAQAQIDGGLHDVFQTDRFGNWIKAGEIYVPEHEPGATNYVEHWVLFDNYVYPSANNPVVTMIVPSRRSNYTSEQDFFARAPWRPGFRYVRVDCIDTTQLPGR
jgi:hypothetical protein